MKVNELEGKDLDRAVAKASGWSNLDHVPAFSTDWAVGGPLLERNRIRLFPAAREWIAQAQNNLKLEPVWFGKTPLIAACRAFVAYRLGDEI